MEKLSKTDLIYRSIARDFLVFATFWLYLWLVIDMKLIYHGAGRIADFPTFLCTSSYFKSFMVNPGGLVGYLSSFIAQTFYYSCLGSAVVAVICWINSGLTCYVLGRLGLRKFDFLRFGSVVFSAVTFGAYLYQFYFVVAFTIVLVTASIFVRFSLKNAIVDFVFLVVLSCFLYTAAGGSFYIFAFVALAYLITLGRWRWALLYSVVAALVPYLIGCVIFKDSLHNGYCCLTPIYWKTVTFVGKRIYLIPAYVFYLLMPLAGCVVLIKAGLAKKYPYLFLKKKPSVKSLKHQKKLSFRAKTSLILNQKFIFKYLIISVLWIIVFASISLCFYRSKRTKFFLADYYYVNRNWSKVIEVAYDFPDSNYYISHFVNHAFYHTGKLTTDMFSIPQHPYSLFLTDPGHADTHWSKIDVYLDLGFLNMAEHEIFESIEAFGPRPFLLKRLITVLLAKREYSTAKVYLNQLGSTLFERFWAEDYLERLKSDADMENDPRIGYLRSVMMEKNYGYMVFQFEDLLMDLLAKNPQNKMAFEYLMAWNLLCGNLVGVIEHFDLASNFDYKALPEYYQHAYLFYTSAMRKKIPLKGWKIETESLKRFNEIVDNFNLMRKQNKRAYEILVNKYNHSYLVYYFSLPSMTGTQK